MSLFRLPPRTWLPLLFRERDVSGAAEVAFRIWMRHHARRWEARLLLGWCPRHWVEEAMVTHTAFPLDATLARRLTAKPNDKPHREAVLAQNPSLTPEGVLVLAHSVHETLWTYAQGKHTFLGHLDTGCQTLHNLSRRPEGLPAEVLDLFRNALGEEPAAPSTLPPEGTLLHPREQEVLRHHAARLLASVQHLEGSELEDLYFRFQGSPPPWEIAQHPAASHRLLLRMLADHPAVLGLHQAVLRHPERLSNPEIRRRLREEGQPPILLSLLGHGPEEERRETFVRLARLHPRSALEQLERNPALFPLLAPPSLLPLLSSAEAEIRTRALTLLHRLGSTGEDSRPLSLATPAAPAPRPRAR